MATTTNLGIRLPDQTTSPPDVAGWMGTALGDVDTILGTGSKPIKVAAPTANENPLRRGDVLYGPAANVPATLAPGVMYLGW